ncbi:hypothetical protein E3N88_17285 [Mikania micrantha]|uniref:EF-hand domain-containing protein n=1 Tax=Mikania micrantha TaxID=192012 RepID=A0A5N6NSU6_9ASTR|nr:hypothetical protein E3N88_17285 [Mikania micrantha]
MDAEMLHQEEVAQQGPPLDPETFALSQHAWLQFEPQSAQAVRCRRILRMSVPTPHCIDWGLLADAGEAARARAILGEDTPWTRLFDLADLPTYRLITVEVLSTFRYRAHQAAVQEEDDEELPPDIEFSLCGQHFEMSIERFAVHLGIYYEPETVRDDFAQGLTQGEEGVMRAWWSQTDMSVDKEPVKLDDEQLTELREVFRSFDRNNDGSLTQLELGSLLRSLGLTPSPDQLDALIQKADTNSNGFVEFSEFVALVSPELLPAKSPYTDDQLKQLFKMFDRDGNGYITAAELAHSMAELGHALTAEELTGMIKEADTDGDGRINFQEFSRAITSAAFDNSFN